ncbi:hypothetical protein [Bacillus coahuilensis]|nr:hypothetical protein [Bacillus coahuilensis]
MENHRRISDDPIQKGSSLPPRSIKHGHKKKNDPKEAEKDPKDTSSDKLMINGLLIVFILLPAAFYFGYSYIQDTNIQKQVEINGTIKVEE